jgi:hypothetical protein
MYKSYFLENSDFYSGQNAKFYRRIKTKKQALAIIDWAIEKKDKSRFFSNFKKGYEKMKKENPDQFKNIKSFDKFMIIQINKVLNRATREEDIKYSLETIL